jgi:fluoride exporter
VVTVLLVLVLGGGAGVARYLVDGSVQSRQRGEFPLGTLVVNAGGCIALGLLAGLGASSQTMLLLGTATIGSYTTFSTWMLETHRPAEDGDVEMAWRNVVISLVAGLICAALGRALGTAL